MRGNQPRGHCHIQFNSIATLPLSVDLQKTGFGSSLDNLAIQLQLKLVAPTGQTQGQGTSLIGVVLFTVALWWSFLD